jgi:hypothetical protein
MLVDSLKRNTFFALSICFMLLFALWAPQLFSLGGDPSGEACRQMQAHSLWMGLLPDSLLLKYVAFFLTFVAAASLFILNNRHFFHPANEFLLPLLYILLASAIPATQWFSGIQVAVLLIIAGLNYLFASYQRAPGLAELFIAAFCFSLATLCFPPVFLFLLLLPVGLMIFRTFAWRDWATIFFGVLTPYVYLLLYDWLAMHRAADAYDAFALLLPQGLPEAPFGNMPLGIFFTCLAILLFLSLTHNLAKASANKIKTMHIRAVFTWMLLLGIAGLFFYPSYNYQIMPLLALPVTAITANYLAQSGRRKMKILCWLFLLAAVIYLHVEEFL